MVHGLPIWAISIGLIIAGEPSLGVIAVPPLGELFWAVKGAGAWLDGQKLWARDAPSFTIRIMSVSGPMPSGSLIRDRFPAGFVTWEAPAASNPLSPPIAFRPPFSSASKSTTSLRVSSSQAKRAASSVT